MTARTLTAAINRAIGGPPPNTATREQTKANRRTAKRTAITHKHRHGADR